MKNILVFLGAALSVCIAQAIPILAACSFIYDWDIGTQVVLVLISAMEIVLVSAYITFEFEQN